MATILAPRLDHIILYSPYHLEVLGGSSSSMTTPRWTNPVTGDQYTLPDVTPSTCLQEPWQRQLHHASFICL
jgi:hypothetical protein